MIILTSGQADAVRGLNASQTAMLQPRALLDGTFALPDSVLTDPAHAAHHALLASLPIRSVADNEWTPTDE